MNVFFRKKYNNITSITIIVLNTDRSLVEIGVSAVVTVRRWEFFNYSLGHMVDETIMLFNCLHPRQHARNFLALISALSPR